ncbi:MAG TPA: hypothetical protein PKH94_00335 [Bacteroidales bacterium]|nr:hypothetical protein [Bacteroidales bacterium]HNS45663.1 hypothetical protein [Bacteroidales bacterium]
MKNRAIIYFFLFALVLFLAFPLVTLSQNVEPKEVKLLKYDRSSLFSSHDLIEMKLFTDFRSMFREIRTNADTVNHDGTAVYKRPDGSWDTLGVEIRPRGNYRRDPSHCVFPPLSVKFNKKQSKNTPFEDLKRLKLVTHCSNTEKIFEQYVLREYLVYRIFNVLTDTAFRVRLARITYVDTEGEMDTLQRFAFFIENDDQMAERVGGKVIEVKNIHQDRTDQKHTDLLEVYMYLVGNPDWSVSVQHNVKIIQTSPFLEPMAIPYDFDYCGIVNTSYAAPADELDIASVTQRVFLGFCRTKEEFNACFDLFRSKKEEIYALYRDLPYLDERSLNWSLSYLDRFYEIIDDPKLVQKEFLKTCWPPR